MSAIATSVCESGRGLPHSKTLREFRQVLDCGSPLPLLIPFRVPRSALGVPR
jgi:hypothetical protein